MDRFRWNAWNLEHATQHGISPMESEGVVRRRGRGWPRKVSSGKYMIQGRGQAGRFVQVVFTIDPDGTFYIIHAMPLTGRRRR